MNQSVYSVCDILEQTSTYLIIARERVFYRFSTARAYARRMGQALIRESKDTVTVYQGY